jgi:hypothetical protein
MLDVSLVKMLKVAIAQTKATPANANGVENWVRWRL